MPKINNKSLFEYISAPAPRYLLRLCVLNSLFKKILTGKEKSFIEIGPGRGDVFHYLIDRPCISRGVAIDFSEESVANLKKRITTKKDYSVFCIDLFEEDFNESFDYILAFEVLEHIEQDEKFLDILYKITNTNGSVFISVPAYMKKWQMQDEYSGHIRRYEKHELAEKLEEAGFIVDTIIDYGFPLTTLIKPLRQLYYKEGASNQSLKERTKKSGHERKFFGNKNTFITLIILSPFIWLQRFFYTKQLGDGLIVIARKI